MSTDRLSPCPQRISHYLRFSPFLVDLRSTEVYTTPEALAFRRTTRLTPLGLRIQLLPHFSVPARSASEKKELVYI